MTDFEGWVYWVLLKLSIDEPWINVIISPQITLSFFIALVKLFFFFFWKKCSDIFLISPQKYLFRVLIGSTSALWGTSDEYQFSWRNKINIFQIPLVIWSYVLCKSLPHDLNSASGDLLQIKWVSSGQWQNVQSRCISTVWSVSLLYVSFNQQYQWFCKRAVKPLIRLDGRVILIWVFGACIYVL